LTVDFILSFLKSVEGFTLISVRTRSIPFGQQVLFCVFCSYKQWRTIKSVVHKPMQNYNGWKLISSLEAHGN